MHINSAISSILCLTTFLCISFAKNVLFIHEETPETYKEFIDYLRNDKKYTVTEHSIYSSGISILSKDQQSNEFDDLIIAPITSTKAKLSDHELLRFYENGGNMLFMGSASQSNNNPIRKFLNSIGIYPSPKNYVTEDYESDTTSDLAIKNSELFMNNFIFDNSDENKVVSLRNTSTALIDTNEMIIPVLRQSVYMKNSLKNNVWALSNQGYLAVSFQNLNNNRISWIGSDYVFADEGINTEDNFELVKEVVKWTFQEKAMLKVMEFKHYQIVEEKTKSIDQVTYKDVYSSSFSNLSYSEEPYKVKDFVNVDLFLAELVSNSDGEMEYKPFVADDIQFELRMIDPYYRLNLVQDKSDLTHYTTEKFQLPDHHGVFTFSINYQRKGLSNIDVKDVKAIRNLAHTEYPRSFEIKNSWVYMSTIFSVISLWIVYVVMFIITSKRVQTSKQVEKKEQ